jgi:hypothetical protein
MATFGAECGPALAEAGLSAGTHFHDLRHTGNTLTAAAGASLRELMDRMGHSSPRAALVYLHGSDARQRAIADGLSRLVEGSCGCGLRVLRRGPGVTIGHAAGTQEAAYMLTVEPERANDLSCDLVWWAVLDLNQ